MCFHIFRSGRDVQKKCLAYCWIGPPFREFQTWMLGGNCQEKLAAGRDGRTWIGQGQPADWLSGKGSRLCFSVVCMNSA